MTAVAKRKYGVINPIPPQNKEVRGQISELVKSLQDKCGTGELKEAGGGEEPLIHHFAPGIYCREYHIKKGDLVVGKIHKTCHMSIISKGKVSVKSQYGDEQYTAPCIFRSEIGVQRVVYAHEDTVWTTIHAVDTTDVDDIEDKVVTTSYDEIDKLLLVQEDTGED